MLGITRTSHTANSETRSGKQRKKGVKVTEEISWAQEHNKTEGTQLMT